MSAKRREKKYYNIALKAQRDFSFGRSLRICAVIAANCAEPKKTRKSVLVQTYADFDLFDAGSDALDAALKEDKYDVIIPNIAAPLPPDAFFRIAQAAALHPDADAFLSCGEGFDAYTCRLYLAGGAEAEAASPCFTGKRPAERAPARADARICAGMVVFNGDLEKAAANAENIIRQVDAFFFIDNGSDDISPLESRFAGNGKVRFIKNGENKGIAYALNRALETASESGFDWLLTLDQDTVCDPELMSVYSRYIHLEKLGIICPFVIHRGKCEPEDYLAEPKLEAEFFHTYDRCITSAALTNVAAAKAVGGFNDELFIDAVDFDINQKLLLNGYSILRANDAYIVQEIGERIPIRFFRFIYLLTRIKKYNFISYYSVHSDTRLYYIARNYKWFLKKYKQTSPAVNRWSNFKDMLLRFVLYPRKRSRVKMFKAVRKGRRDARKMTY